MERLGRFNRVLKPGLSFIIPLIEAPRAFTWRKTFVDPSGRIRDETITHTRIDLRESLFAFVRSEFMRCVCARACVVVVGVCVGGGP